MRPIEYFDNGHDLNPEAVCLLQDETGREYTYRDVREMTLRVGNGLLAEGFAHGVRGAVLSINNPAGLIAALSFLRCGMVWVPINPGNALVENIHALQDFDCEVLFYHSVFEAAIDTIRAEVPRIRRYICIDQAGAAAPFLEDWLAQFPADEIDVPDADEDLATIQPTGGTTGRSKGARLPNRAVSAFIMVNLAVTSYDDLPPVYLAAAPMTHAGGYICFAILARGGTIIVQAKVEPDAFLAAIPKYKVSALFLPPTVIYVLLGRPGIETLDFASLKHFIYGAAPMSPDKLVEAMEVFGPVMTQMFGQSECLFPLTYMSPADHAKVVASNNLKPLASCGKPSPNCRLGIMDDDGNLLPDGEIGEIVVRSPMLMQGYHKNPVLTRETIKDGWLHTGDVGYRDGANFFYIVDRKKDMIITGGFNVYSAEVEKAVLSHPDVQECAVIGVPHEKWGEEVKAVVERRDGANVTEADIIALCKDAVGSVKAPKSVDFTDALPRNPNGKIMKRAIREEYWADAERQVN